MGVTVTAPIPADPGIRRPDAAAVADSAPVAMAVLRMRLGAAAHGERCGSDTATRPD